MRVWATSSPGVRIPPSPPFFVVPARVRIAQVCLPARLRIAQVGSAGSRARERREPGQAGNGAAISVRLFVLGVPGGLHLRAPRARGSSCAHGWAGHLGIAGTQQKPADDAIATCACGLAC